MDRTAARGLAATIALLLLGAPSVRAGVVDGSSCPPEPPANQGILQGIAGAVGGAWNWVIGNGGAAAEGTLRSKDGIERKYKAEVADHGCGMVAASFSGSTAYAPKVSGHTGPVHGSIVPKIGAAGNLEIILPREAWSPFQNDPNRPRPNPLDPSTLPPGSTAVLKAESFAAMEMEGAYRALMARAEIVESAGNVVAVTRTESGKVVLSVGPYEAVKNEAYVAIGTHGARAGIANTKRLESGRVTRWEFDPSDPREMEAFYAAVGKGMVLGRADGGARHAEKIRTIDFKDQTAIKAEIGSDSLFSVDKTILSSSGKVKITTDEKGNKEIETEAAYGNETVTVTKTVGPDGSVIAGPKHEVKFKGLSAHNAAMLGKAVGIAKVGPDTTLTLEGDDWIGYRDRAREYLRARGSLASSPFLERLANARGPDDVAIALYQSARQYTRTFEELELLTRDLADPRKDGPRLPGKAKPTSCHHA